MYKIRTLEKKDLPAIYNLTRLTLVYDNMSLGLIEEKTFADPYLNLDCSFVAEAGNELIAAAPVVIRERQNPQHLVAYIQFFCTRPDFTQTGIMSAIFGNLENKLLTLGVHKWRIMDQPENYLMPGVDFRYTAAHCFLNKHKFAFEKHRLNLTAHPEPKIFPTAEKLIQLKKSNIEIVRLQLTQFTELEKFLEQHFALWCTEVKNTLKNEPISTFIATHNQHIIGFSSYEGNNRGMGWFGPMGVAPEYRKMGIGEILTTIVLQDLWCKGHRQVIIPWVGPTRFYSRICDAKMDRIFFAYEKILKKY